MIRNTDTSGPPFSTWMCKIAQGKLIIITNCLSSSDFLVVSCLTHSKNWTSSWTVLQGSQLIFAKSQAVATSWVSDNLIFANLGRERVFTYVLFQFGSHQSKTEFSVDLKGATVEKASKDKSSKKHVLEVNTTDWINYLINDCSQKFLISTAIVKKIYNQLWFMHRARWCRAHHTVPSESIETAETVQSHYTSLWA